MSTSPTSSFDKISPTALLVAYARQFSNIPYTKEIAELTDAASIIKQFVREGEQQPIVAAALIEARYKMIEQVRAKFNGTQILELASGLLPRGMINTQHPEITFVESDLPGMIEHKQQLIQQLVGERPNLHCLQIDATHSSDFLPLSDYFQPEKPIMVLCEGLLMYLTLAEKQQVLENVHSLLQTYGGVWITPDFTTKTASRLRDRDLHKVRQNISSFTSRSLADGQFDDLTQAKAFIQEQGFQVKEFSMLEVIDQLSSISVLEIDLERAKPMLAATPVFALTLG
jgi:O-methyltransferase involved in polyketide biosynthesis